MLRLLLLLSLAARPSPFQPVELPGLPGLPGALPGKPGPIQLDYLGVEPSGHRVWIPAGGTGKVDVLDLASGELTAVEGFATAGVDGRVVGPSSVTFSATHAFVGDRADHSVCAVELATLSRKGCVVLPSMPDGLAYVAATGEVWATTPATQSLALISVVDPMQLRVVANLPVGGSPEGYAVDAAGGRFFTNLEDGDRTLALDVHSRQIVQSVSPGCGAAGPRGLDFDARHARLWVACTDQVVWLDAAHALATGARVATGKGVDSIAFDPDLGVLYAAAGRSGTLTVARWSDAGVLRSTETLPTAHGVRTVVAASGGRAVLADPKAGQLLRYAVLPRRAVAP